MGQELREEVKGRCEVEHGTEVFGFRCPRREMEALRTIALQEGVRRGVQTSAWDLLRDYVTAVVKAGKPMIKGAK